MSRALPSRVAPFRGHRYEGVSMLDDLWRKDGRVYRTIGIITDPALVIEDIATGKRETHVIHSLNFAEYERLRPADRSGHSEDTP